MDPDPDPCPVLRRDDRRGGGIAPSANGEAIGTDLDALAAAVPERAGGLRRRDLSSWARGDAGHWSPGVAASYPYEDDDLTIVVDDLIHVCSAEPGMGEVLQRRRLAASEGARPVEVAGHPAVIGESPERGAELRAWINDRCAVRVSAFAPLAVVRSVADAIDWAALAAACPAHAE